MANHIQFRTNTDIRAAMNPHERKQFDSDQHELTITRDNGSNYRIGLTDDEALDLMGQIQAAGLISTADWKAGYRASVEANKA
jgi:hypothetical protein